MDRLRTVPRLTAALLLAIVPSLAAQEADPDPSRFASAIEDFQSWDSKNTVPTGATLFVGSSSIRFWNTAERFPDLDLVNRGFGGSHISDVNHFVRETVLKHDPSVVIFYAGDNDIGAGKGPEQVLEDYQEFVAAVHGSSATTEIVFLAIKPSLARWSLWSTMVEANELIRDFSAGDDRLHYGDVATPMLGSDGKPMPRLFVSDGLHMTPAGYDIWDRVLRGTLAEIH